MSASRRAILTVHKKLFMSAPADSLRCFSSVHQTQGGNWVDDIRKGPDEDGRTGSGMPDRSREDNTRNSMDGAEQGARNMADATRGTTGSVADMAKEGAAKAMETGIDLGEKAKQTMDAAWDSVRMTIKNVKDAVAGDNIDDHERRNQSTDSHVENLRKREGGYDLRDK